MMITIADKVFDEFESRCKIAVDENGNGNKNQFKVDLSDLMVKYTSSVIVSGFLGMDSLKEKLRDRPLAESILKATFMATDSLKDPLLLLLGNKFLNLGWRKCDREFIGLKN